MKYRVVATGGTFDHMHKGHKALLSKSFEAGKKVVIGVTSDEFAAKHGKSPDLSYDERVAALRSHLRHAHPGAEYVISKLDDYFGPGIASEEVEAIVVSEETASRVPIANELRERRGFPPLKVILVDYVLAEDGKPVSSTRIRNGEIDEDGRVRRKGL
jgi:cytidyltransferase-like protein